MAQQVVGGGAKKVLYTLNTVRRIGVTKAAKALNARNACKACALGMGGQLGGMTNELGEFPSICNKSVQAQSTDIQPAIPDEIFDHPLDQLRELTGKELEGLGRLAAPIWKAAGADHYQKLGWDEAMERLAAAFRATDPDRSFFYSSGRSSNEAGFLFQLIARLFGTNNVTNCSYYCHQATSVALGSTIGTGTSTVELADLKESDCVFVIGANPSSNHPRFIHLLKGVRDRGGEVVVINPAKEAGLVKFAVPKSPKSMMTGGDEIASAYAQPHIGGDLALFKGIAKALLAKGHQDDGFLAQYCSGFDVFRDDLGATDWEEIVSRSGVSRGEIEQLADIYGQAKKPVFAWGMGMTHHVHGVDNIEYIANLALLCGAIGRPGAGLLPLRGHSNVQGVGTIGVKPVLADDVARQIEEHFSVRFPEKKGLDTMASMQAASDGKVNAALIMGGNLYAANPDSDWAEKALDAIGFKCFLTTTLNQGHVHGVDSGEVLILPVAARDEEWEPTTQESMFNFVRLSDGGIIRHATVRPEVVILADFAEKLLPDCGVDFGAFKTHRRIREAIAATVPGMEQLADIDVAKQEFHVANRIKHKPDFDMPGGKARFQVRSLPKTQTDEGRYTLTTVRSEGQFNSIVYEEKDSYRQTETRWCVMMNQQDMAALGLEEGDRTTMRSGHGEMKDLTVYGFDLPPGNVMAYYPEANILTSTAVDPRSKTPSFKATQVSIVPQDGRADTAAELAD